VKFLVDANVLSEATKPAPSAHVVRWLAENESELATSAVVLGELEYGILLMPSGRRRRRLQEWFAGGARRLQVVDFDSDCASAWARLLARLRRRGLAMPVKDSLIAATALAHDLTVVTRNLTDFRCADVPLVNPFEE